MLFRSNINVDNTNIPSGTGDIKAICDAYNKMLSENVIDVQLLGIGSNGHIGFNEPGTSFDSVTHSIELDESTRIDNSIYFKSLDDVPTEAVTMGLSNIMDAKKVVLIATGEGKSWAINELVNNPKSTNVPASVLQSHKDVIILLDKEAASKL